MTQSSYTQEVGAAICARMAEGESLRQICRDESMPSLSTVMKWAREIEAFSQQYARAREALLEHWAEEITEIADDATNDWVNREAKSGHTDRVIDAEHVNRSRLRIDTRKWLLSKLMPKKYGDVSEVTINHRRAADLTDAELSDIASGRSEGIAESPASPQQPGIVH